MTLPESVPVIVLLDRQLADAYAEVEALKACLDEQHSFIEELQQRRTELVGRDERPRLNGAMVRDAIRRLGRFTFAELRAELGYPAVEVRKFFKPMLLGGSIAEVGRVGRAPFYECRRPDGPHPTHHPTRRPPEKDPPAMTESRATGEPVRVGAQEKIGRRGRSTPGTSHHAKQRDANYERAQAKRAERIEAQKAKAQREPKWKRRK